MADIHFNAKIVKGLLFANMEHANTLVKNVEDRVFVNTNESSSIVRIVEAYPYALTINAEVVVWNVRVEAFAPIKK